MTKTIFTDEKTLFELPKVHLSGFVDSPRIHQHGFMGYLCGIFVHLGTHHIA